MSFAVNYRKRVQRDVRDWVARGWVHPEHADELVASIPDRNLRDSLPAIVATLGAVLFAFAAITFVASNWHEIPKSVRLAGLFLVMWGTWLGAIIAYRSGRTFLHEAAIVLGCGLFGANIMLIAQMYHIDSHFPDGVLVWAMGSLLAAGLTRSSGAVVAGFGLLCLWTGMVSEEFRSGVHWEFLIAWAAAAWLMWHDRWNEGMAATFSALFVWANLSILSAADAYNWPFAVLIALLTVLALVTLLTVRLAEVTEFTTRIGSQSIVRTVSFSALVIGLFAIQFVAGEIADVSFFETASSGNSAVHWAGLFAGGCAIAALLSGALYWRGGAEVRDICIAAGIAAVLFLALGLKFNEALLVAILAAGAFGLCVWIISLGQVLDRTALLNFGFVAFGIEALYIYFRTLGSLLDTALFFLLGGIILFGLALVLERTRRQLLHQRRTERAA